MFGRHRKLNLHDARPCSYTLLPIEWPGREANCLPPSGAEVKDTGTYISTPPSSWRNAQLSNFSENLITKLILSNRINLVVKHGKG
jgi:hypothetical protein